MIFTRKLIHHLATISLLTISSALSTSISSSTIYRFDTDGNAIDSTSGKIDYLGGSYLWYGLNFGCGKAFCGIQSWSSPDLVRCLILGVVVTMSNTALRSAGGLTVCFSIRMLLNSWSYVKLRVTVVDHTLCIARRQRSMSCG